MTIIYETEQKELKVSKGESLLDACLSNNIDISHSCEGGASCGTCRVFITKGLSTLPPRGPLEQDMADDRAFSAQERLACQTQLDSSFDFYLPDDRSPINK